MHVQGFCSTIIHVNVLVESKELLVKEIKAVIPDLEESYITNKIERAHRSKETEYKKTPAIATKFNDWQLTETIKISFIKSKSHIFVSQMYSPMLTKRRNEAMNVRKELKKSDPTIQAYVKFQAKLMIRNGKGKEYSLYAEY